MRAVRLVGTLVAVLGGAALYTFLAQRDVGQPIAFIAGLIFALLGRAALTALASEWLRDAARRRDTLRSDASTNAARSPTTRRKR